MKKINLLKVFLSFVLILSTLIPLSVSTAEAASKTYSATVNATTLNVREKTSSTSKKVGSLKKGTKVTVYAKTKSGWSEIRYKSKKAYVSTKYLKFPTSSSYTSYKRNPKKIYTYQNYEYHGDKKTDITHSTIKYVKKTSKGDLWSDGMVWQENSKGITVISGSGENEYKYRYLAYPVKKGTWWKDNGDWYKNSISSVNTTVKTKVGTFKNCIVVDYNYMILTFAKNVGLVRVETRGGFFTELESIKNK